MTRAEMNYLVEYATTLINYMPISEQWRAAYLAVELRRLVAYVRALEAEVEDAGVF